MTRTFSSRPWWSRDLLTLITRSGDSVTDMNGGEDSSPPARCLMKISLLITKSSADYFLQPTQQIPSSTSCRLALKSWWRRYKILIESSAALLEGKSDRLWCEWGIGILVPPASVVMYVLRRLKISNRIRFCFWTCNGLLSTSFTSRDKRKSSSPTISGKLTGVGCDVVNNWFIWSSCVVLEMIWVILFRQIDTKLLRSRASLSCGVFSLSLLRKLSTSMTLCFLLSNISCASPCILSATLRGSKLSRSP